MGMATKIFTMGMLIFAVSNMVLYLSDNVLYSWGEIDWLSILATLVLFGAALLAGDLLAGESFRFITIILLLFGTLFSVTFLGVTLGLGLATNIYALEGDPWGLYTMVMYLVTAVTFLSGMIVASGGDSA